MSALLEIHDLEIRFGSVEALRGISLHVNEDEVLGLLEPAAQVASRVAVMRAGEVVETGPSARLLTAPEHAYTRCLLAAVPTHRNDWNQPLALVGHSTTSASGLYSPHAG